MEKYVVYSISGTDVTGESAFDLLPDAITYAKAQAADKSKWYSARHKQLYKPHILIMRETYDEVGNFIDCLGTEEMIPIK